MKEAFLESFQIAGRAIAGHDDLFSRLMKLVEDVKEHFLRLFTSREKLNIVEDKKVDLQIIILKLLDLVILEGIQELACKSRSDRRTGQS